MDLNSLVFKHIFQSALVIRREWFIPYQRSLEHSQYYLPQRLKEIQEEKFKNLILHARRNTEHYGQIIPDDVLRIADLERIPLLEKATIRENASALSCKSGVFQRQKTSGGSTGAPVTLLKDNRGMAHELAATWRGYGWAGVGLGDRQVRFWGVPRNDKDKWRARLIDFVCNRKRVTAFGYNTSGFAETLADLERFQPAYLYGYTSIIRELADYQLDSGISSKMKLKSVITTSEVLSGIDREKIESAFAVKVFDEYGCGEVGTIAHECERGRKHINAENMIVEIIDESGNVLPEGESGEIVVTDLTNYSMPLIRYRLKDWGRLSADPCPCGRTLPVLDEVFGRQYDTLVNRVGQRFHGEFFLYIAEDAKKEGLSLDGIQFVQSTTQKIAVQLVCKQHDVSRLERFIAERLAVDFDPNIELEFSRADSISREPSGKLRVVKRLMG